MGALRAPPHHTDCLTISDWILATPFTAWDPMTQVSHADPLAVPFLNHRHPPQAVHIPREQGGHMLQGQSGEREGGSCSSGQLEPRLASLSTGLPEPRQLRAQPVDLAELSRCCVTNRKR